MEGLLTDADRRLVVVVAGIGVRAAPGVVVEVGATVRADEVRAAIVGLEERGLRTGFAEYWAAYPLVYFADERIVVAPVLPSPVARTTTTSERLAVSSTNISAVSR